MNFSKENIKKIMLLIVFTILILVGLQRFDQILNVVGVLWQITFPFVLGAAMAFILNVPMNFLERVFFSRQDGKKARFSRAISLVGALLIVILIIYLVVQVVVPELGKTVVTLARTVERSLPQIQDWAANMFRDNEQIYNWINHLDMNWERMISSALDMVKNGVGNVVTSTVSVTMGIARALANLAIGFVFACYILLQKEKLSRQCKMVLKAFLPEKTEKYVLHVFELSYRTFSNFVTGQCIEAVILGTMFLVVLTILRFPYALLIGVLIAFTALIPIFGAFIGCVISVLLILIINPVQALIFVIVFLILQQIEGNLIYPHVVGGSVGLPSIWVLVAVTVGGNLLGVAGMLIFIPLTSVMYALFREWVHGRLAEKAKEKNALPEEKQQEK